MRESRKKTVHQHREIGKADVMSAAAAAAWGDYCYWGESLRRDQSDEIGRVA